LDAAATGGGGTKDAVSLPHDAQQQAQAELAPPNPSPSVAIDMAINLIIDRPSS
jgi:hypothetical protein